jgi:trigger factor
MMDVTIEETGAHNRMLTISISASEVDKRYNQKLKAMSSTAQIPGFRRGRVPAPMIQARYGSRMGAEVAEELFRSTYATALRNNNLRALGDPDVQIPEPVKPGQPFIYKAAIQIIPEIEPKGHIGMNLVRPIPQISDADVDAVITNMRQSKTTYTPDPDHAATIGDQLLLDFTGSIDGQIFDGGTAENTTMELGRMRFVEGFEEQLAGVKSGERKLINVRFPDDYHATHLASKKVVFDCDIKEVRRANTPSDETVLKEWDAPKEIEKTMAAFREDIHARLAKKAQAEARENIKRQIQNILLDANKQELPSKLIDKEVELLVQQAKDDLASRGVNPAALGRTEKQWADALRGKAYGRVLLGMIIGTLGRQEKLSPSDQALESFIDSSVEGMAEPEKTKAWILSNKDNKEQLRGMALEAAVMDWIVERASVTEEPRALADMLKIPGEMTPNAGGTA